MLFEYHAKLLQFIGNQMKYIENNNKLYLL